ncbi:hypothetical protein EI94DRAFT_1147171 [Lactarius quietus]|nr:hypothetical protein EI94DRAFT_1147171 [Lactarius quietus]
MTHPTYLSRSYIQFRAVLSLFSKCDLATSVSLQRDVCCVTPAAAVSLTHPARARLGTCIALRAPEDRGALRAMATLRLWKKPHKSRPPAMTVTVRIREAYNRDDGLFFLFGEMFAPKHCVRDRTLVQFFLPDAFMDMTLPPHLSPLPLSFDPHCSP